MLHFVPAICDAHFIQSDVSLRSFHAELENGFLIVGESITFIIFTKYENIFFPIHKAIIP
jgi:hypothetical protein